MTKNAARVASSGSSAPRKGWRRALLLFGTILFIAVLAEVGLRIYAKITLQGRGQTYHPEFGWAPLPNVKKVGFFWGRQEPGWTNSLGWRDRETPLKKPPGKRRVVALGDSFTFGARLDYGERFSEVLERDLKDLEVINLGVNAYGTDQQLRVLEVEGLHYEADIVVQAVFLGNDLDDIRYEKHFSWPKPHYELEGGELRLINPKLTWDVWVRNVSYVGEMVFRLSDRFVPSSRHVVASSWKTTDTVPLFLALIRRAREVARDDGVHYLVMLIYPRESYLKEPTEMEQRVRAGLEEASIPTLDTFSLFSTRAARGENLFADDGGHWGRLGNELAASAMAAEFKKRDWLKD